MGKKFLQLDDDEFVLKDGEPCWDGGSYLGKKKDKCGSGNDECHETK